jgi:hypothetical protein
MERWPDRVRAVEMLEGGACVVAWGKRKGSAEGRTRLLVRHGNYWLGRAGVGRRLIREHRRSSLQLAGMHMRGAAGALDELPRDVEAVNAPPVQLRWSV